MSRLDELIEKLCPNGVKYRSFGESAIIVRGASPRPIKKYITTDSTGTNWIKIGDVKPGDKYITSSAEKITLEGAKKSRAVKKGDFILSNSMSFGRPYILQIDGCIHDGWLAISDFSDSYLPDFLYHLLSSKSCQSEMQKKASFGGAVQNLNADIVRALVLPVPPMEIQQEIVHILDSFTALTAKLTDELSSEIVVRKRQYEFYRNELLTLDVDKCSVSKLSEIAQIYDGTHQTPEYMSDGIPFISVENINDIYSSNKYISEKAYNKYKIKPQKNDLFMTRIGSIGKCAIMKRSTDLAYYVSLALIRPNAEILDCRYLKHYIESTFGTRELAKRTLHNAVPIKINKEDIGKITIHYPNMELQRKIVRVLDNFDKICFDLNIELPAEIEARQKQYEYYRDLLLTFAEKGSIVLTDRQTDRQS